MNKSNYNTFCTQSNSLNDSCLWNDLLVNKKFPQVVVSKYITESYFVSPDLSIVYANIRV
jgi:hypothetical protein